MAKLGDNKNANDFLRAVAGKAIYTDRGWMIRRSDLRELVRQFGVTPKDEADKVLSRRFRSFEEAAQGFKNEHEDLTPVDPDVIPIAMQNFPKVAAGA